MSDDAKVLPKHATVFKKIDLALLGVPKDAPAEEINLRLWAQAVFSETKAALGTDLSYAYFRSCVRQVLRERARWCRWEGRDARGVIAPYRYRKGRLAS